MWMRQLKKRNYKRRLARGTGLEFANFQFARPAAPFGACRLKWEVTSRLLAGFPLRTKRSLGITTLFAAILSSCELEMLNERTTSSLYQSRISGRQRLYDMARGKDRRGG